MGVVARTTQRVTVDWRFLGLAGLWAVNAVLLAVTLSAFVAADVAADWFLYVEAGPRFWEGNLYHWPTSDGSWRYSPLLAPVFALIAPIGYLGWTALHFAALLLLPRRLALIALLMAPFWYDVYNGNTSTFVAVAAVLAVRGSRWGTLAFLVLCALIPRPIMLPVLGYILWTRREYVLPFAAIFVVHALAVWMTGWGPEWIDTLVNRGGDDIAQRIDFGPSRFLGLWWYPFGLAIAVVLSLRGHLGWASLFASPYWLLHYWLMLLLDADDAVVDRAVGPEVSGRTLLRVKGR